MVDRHKQLEQPKCRPRWGSLVSEQAFLDMLGNGSDAIVRFYPATYSHLSPATVNIYARRHSAHSYPTTEQATTPGDTQPTIPKRTQLPATTTLAQQPTKKVVRSQQPPAVPPRTRILPPLPPPDTKPRATQAVPPSDTKPRANQAVPPSDKKPRATQAVPPSDTKPRATQALPPSDTKPRGTQAVPLSDTKPRATQAIPPADTKLRATQAVPPSDTKPRATQAIPPADTKPRATQAVPLSDTKPRATQAIPPADTKPRATQAVPSSDTKPRATQAVPPSDTKPRATQAIPPADTKPRASQAVPPSDTKPRATQTIPPADTKPRANQAVPPSDTKPRATQAVPPSDTKSRGTQTVLPSDTKPRATKAVPSSDTKPRETQAVPSSDTKPRATQAVPSSDTKPRATQAVPTPETKPRATQAVPPPESSAVAKLKSILSYNANKIPPAPAGPPPPTPKINNHKPSVQINKTAGVQQYNVNKVSVRQDSSVSSDSFSQTSSPSYTTKTMETPLLPPRTPLKQNGLLIKNHMAEVEANANGTITKSASTPASLQTIVKFHNGSNMSLHHRIIRDMRRPSSHYVSGVRLRYRFAQIILNAVALLVIGGGMAAYFRAYSTSPPVVNPTVKTNHTPEKALIGVNPAPGICLPVIVSFCQYHKVPYNYTVFPNYMGHFGQRDAQQELEVYDALVDVRCYELAALFLCSVFVPKCGPGGVVVRPCLSLCMETKRRCGFFLDVFGLTLPDYLDCSLFPESPDPEICVGHREVREARIRSQKPVCPSGFQCDVRRCIPKDWQCDGHVDCKDQSDELNCEKCGPGMIHCGEDKCMTQEHMCDGTVDCPWAQDERNCLRLSERNGDEGRGQLEVFRPEQQKWVPACVEFWNQSTSPGTICSLLGYSRSRASRVLGSMEPDRNTFDVLDMPQNNYWRRKYRRSKNMLKEFSSCEEKIYPTVDLNCGDYKCGKIRKTYAESRTLRIVGGVPSKPGDWPFLAALLGGPEEIFYCAGVLIADQWVLTASHCVGNHSDVSGWTIQLGITRRHAHSYYGQKMKVRRVVPHPAYNVGVAHDNDVALFQLSSRVTFHEHLLPVCLPPANKELVPGTVCTVIGWGKKEDTGMSEYEPEVNEVEVPVLNRDLCNSWLENRDLNVTDGMICAGYKEGGKDACQGDSGGPLLCRDDNDQDRWFVGGIVSWGIKCAHPHLPGVYAYVPKYIPWILKQMRLYGN